MVDKKILVGLSTAEHIRRADFLPFFLMMERPEGCSIVTVHGQSPATSRNLIVEEARKANYTHVFFCDDDMAVQKDTLMRLAAHDVDIVSGLYLLRGFPHYPAFFDAAFENGSCKFAFLNDPRYIKGGLVKGVNAGLGCVLISMKVFDTLEKPYVRLGEIEKDGWCDDVGFFNRCRKAGFDIYCDLDVHVGHMSQMTLWPGRIPIGNNGDKKWMVEYRQQAGNVQFDCHMPTGEEVDKQIEENKDKVY